MIRVGDLHEVVAASACAALLVGGANRLNQDSRRVGTEPERRRHRLPAHRLDDGGANGPADLLLPAAHCAAIEREADAGESLLLTMVRNPVTQLLGDEVGKHRRRADRLRNDLGWHPGSNDLRHRGKVGRIITDRHLGCTGRRARDLVVDIAVLDACDHQANPACAAPHDRRVLLFGAEAGEFAFQLDVRDLHPLHRGIGLAEVAAARWGPLLARRAGALACVARSRRPCERIQRSELCGELELELRRIDPRRLSDEQPATHELDLPNQRVVRADQPIVVTLELCVTLALGGERRLELANARPRSTRLIDRGRLAHVPSPIRNGSRCRSPRSISCAQCVVTFRRGDGAASRSIPSSRASSARSSIWTIDVPSGAVGIRNVP